MCLELIEFRMVETLTTRIPTEEPSISRARASCSLDQVFQEVKKVPVTDPR